MEKIGVANCIKRLVTLLCATDSHSLDVEQPHKRRYDDANAYMLVLNKKWSYL